MAAYVLHRYDWSESSLILDLFTREAGRIAVAAKGAKRPYSQLRSVLLPFQRLQVGLGRAAADAASAPDVQNLRAAEWAGGPALPSGAALFRGFYLNELLLRLLPRHDPYPALFDIYAQTLPGLGSADDAHAQATLRAFELCLLRELGVLPDLAVLTATQRPVVADRRYTLRGDSGVADSFAAGEAGIPGALLGAAQAALDRGQLEALREVCRIGAAELRSVLRVLLHYHLGSAALRTREVMRDLQLLQALP